MNFKKLLITTCVAGSLLSLAACSTNKEPVPTNEPTPTAATDNPGLQEGLAPSEPTLEDLSVFRSEIENKRIYEINAETLYSFLNDETKDAVIYLGAPSCSHCRDAIATIHETAEKHKTDVYHVSIDKLSPEDYIKTLEVLDAITMVADEEKNIKDFFIPHVFAIVDGKISTDYSEIGYTDGTDYNYIFEALGGK